MSRNILPRGAKLVDIVLAGISKLKGPLVHRRDNATGAVAVKFGDGVTTAVTLTTAELKSYHLFSCDPDAGASTLTLPTAEALREALGLASGDIFEFVVGNENGSNAITLQTTGGYTIPTAAIAANATRVVRVWFDSATTATLY